MRQLILGWTWEICRWMFPKIVGFPPKSSQFNRGFPLQTIHFGGKIPDFLETPRWQVQGPNSAHWNRESLRNGSLTILCFVLDFRFFLAEQK